MARLRRQDARCIVDASGPALAEALAEGVFLAKPSRRELGLHFGTTLESGECQVEAAAGLVADGSAEHVALTLGGEAPFWPRSPGSSGPAVPDVEVRSTVGAGDSFLAAFVLRLAQGRTLAEALRAAVAAGSATVAITAATELCHREDVERLEAELAAQAADGSGGQ